MRPLEGSNLSLTHGNLRDLLCWLASSLGHYAEGKQVGHFQAVAAHLRQRNA